MHTIGQTYTQTDRQIDRQTDRQTEKILAATEERTSSALQNIFVSGMPTVQRVLDDINRHDYLAFLSTHTLSDTGRHTSYGIP